MRRRRRLACLAGSSLFAWLVSTTALAVDFTHDGAITLDTSQIRNTSDGDNPGRAWEAFLPFPAPVTVNAGDTLRGTISFDRLLRVRDNGGGFFQVGTEKGFEQLIALANSTGPSQVSQEDNALNFNGTRGPALATGSTRVGGVSHNGLFMQAVVDMVSTGEEFLTGGVVYRLGLVSGGPFTVEGIQLRVLAEEIGIVPRPLGDLVYGECITGETDSGPTPGSDACTEIAGAESFGDNSGLNNLRSVVVTPDGTSLYSVSANDDAVVRFDRDPTTGALTYQGCITGKAETGTTGTGACTAVGSATSQGTNSGFDDLQAVAVSADGKSLYAVSVFDDAVIRFDRDPATGALTYQGCITGETETGPAGTNACVQITSATSQGTNSGLDELRSLALSADGKSLYVTAAADDAVARFDRDPATGALSYEGCFTGETETGPTGTGACAQIGSATSAGTDSGLDFVQSVAVSPDGKAVYAGALLDDAVARFDRDPPTGALRYHDCITGETQSNDTACTKIGSATASGTNSGLDDLYALALSPDGTSLYTVSDSDDAVARFDRDPATGALTYRDCITGKTESGATGTNACAQIGSAAPGGVNSGLDKIRSLSVSPSGRTLYVASPADDAVARFDRDPATGALTYQDCLSGKIESGPTGTGACAQIRSATSAGTNSGVDNPQSLAVSPDEGSLYLASGNDAAVARFGLLPEPLPPCLLDVDQSGNLEVATDVVYIARHLLALTPVPPSFRDADPSIPPDDQIARRVDAPGSAFDVDSRGGVEVATDVVYMARHLLALTPVPPSFRVTDPTIPSDEDIASKIDALCPTAEVQLPRSSTPARTQ